MKQCLWFLALLYVVAEGNETGLFGVTKRNAARMKDEKLATSVDQMTILLITDSVSSAPKPLKKQHFDAHHTRGHILSESGFGSNLLSNLETQE